LKVVAGVTNTTSSGLTPASFVFLHVRHADRLGTSWRRIPMTDNGDGTYERTWIARRSGIDRFIVDALDSPPVARHGGQLPDDRSGDSLPDRVVGP